MDNFTIPANLSNADHIKTAGMKRKLEEETHNLSESLLPDTCGPVVVFHDNTEIAEEIILDNGPDTSTTSNVVNEVEEEDVLNEPEKEEEKLSSEAETQTPASLFPLMGIEKFENDDAGIHFYTGLESFTSFTMVLQSLGPAAYCLNYVRHQVNDISVPNQFFLVLIKLRRHLPDIELSLFFNVSEDTVSNVFFTWMVFMSKQWRELDLWPRGSIGKHIVSDISSSDYEIESSRTRLIIDRAEFPIRKPKGSESQRATYSTREKKYTVKVLIGATPEGLVSYVSQAYGGATTDKQIIEESLSDLNVSEELQLDDLQNSFVNKNEHACENRNRNLCALHDCEICKDKDYIERIVRQAKSFKILSEHMSRSETQMASHIAFVCFMLGNFKTRIAPS